MVQIIPQTDLSVGVLAVLVRGLGLVSHCRLAWCLQEVAVNNSPSASDLQKHTVKFMFFFQICILFESGITFMS